MDPNSEALLAPLSGKVVHCQVTGIETDVYLIFLHDGIEVTGFFDAEVDTVVSGTPLAMMSLVRDNAALFGGDVQMSGDVATGRRFKRLLSDLDVDWEEQLSSLFGDTLAHQVFRAGSGFQNMLSRSLNHFGLDVGDYLQEEVSLLAPRTEVKAYCNEVDDLVAALDRLTARLDLLDASPDSSDVMGAPDDASGTH